MMEPQADGVAIGAKIAAESAASAGVIITVTGSVFGMSLETMLIGFVAAIAGQVILPVNKNDSERLLTGYLWSLLQLLCAGVLAGLFTPLVEAVIMQSMVMPIAALRLAVPATIGIAAPIVIALVRRAIEKLGVK